MDYYQKYIKYKLKYLKLKVSQNGASDKNKFNKLEFNNYDLIGIGDFTHGINDIWQYRIDLIKHLVENTHKQIIIFHEILPWHAKNIMTDKKIKINKEYADGFNHPLNRYGWRVYDSPIYLKFIELVRANLQKIKIIGIDIDGLRRDKHMARKILKNMNVNCVNLLFAHNAHIDDRTITEKYEDLSEKYRCGHYLRKILKTKYCIILSSGFKGTIRFDGFCHDESCDKMDVYPKPVNRYFEFVDLKDRYEKQPKYDLVVDKNTHIYEYSRIVLTDQNLATKIFSTNANYILLLNNVEALDLLQ